MSDLSKRQSSHMLNLIESRDFIFLEEVLYGFKNNLFEELAVGSGVAEFEYDNIYYQATRFCYFDLDDEEAVCFGLWSRSAWHYVLMHNQEWEPSLVKVWKGKPTFCAIGFALDNYIAIRLAIRRYGFGC